MIERCFNKLKLWRGIEMRTDKLARNYRAGIALAATLTWLRPGSVGAAHSLGVWKVRVLPKGSGTDSSTPHSCVSSPTRRG